MEDSMFEVEEYPGGYNEPEEENLLTGDEPDNTDEEGGDATELPEKAGDITINNLRDGTRKITETAINLNSKLHREITYYIDAKSDSLKESDFEYFTKLASQFDAAEFYTTNCAIATSTLYRIKFGKILCKLKELNKKYGKRKWENFADEHFEISKETRTLYMRISRINGVDNYAFLGVERLRRITEVLKELKIKDDDQLAVLFNRFSVKVDIDLPVKNFKKTIDELLKKANMKPDKSPPAPAKEKGDNPESKEDEGSSDTPPPSSENGIKTKGTSGKKDKLNQESLNRGIHKLIESVDTFFELEFGEDVLSVEIIDNFQSKLTELNDKLETLKEKITNI